MRRGLIDGTRNCHSDEGSLPTVRRRDRLDARRPVRPLLRQLLDLQNVLRRLNNSAEEACCTHGCLDVAKLAYLLLHDVARLANRPGSWEAIQVADLLAAHGYRV